MKAAFLLLLASLYSCALGSCPIIDSKSFSTENDEAGGCIELRFNGIQSDSFSISNLEKIIISGEVFTDLSLHLSVPDVSFQNFVGPRSLVNMETRDLKTENSTFFHFYVRSEQSIVIDRSSFSLLIVSMESDSSDDCFITDSFVDSLDLTTSCRKLDLSNSYFNIINLFQWNSDRPSTLILTNSRIDRWEDTFEVVFPVKLVKVDSINSSLPELSPNFPKFKESSKILKRAPPNQYIMNFDTLQSNEFVDLTYASKGIYFFGIQALRGVYYISPSTAVAFSSSSVPYINVINGFTSAFSYYMKGDGFTLNIWSDLDIKGTLILSEVISSSPEFSLVTNAFAGVGKSISFHSSCSGCVYFDDMTLYLSEATSPPTTTLPATINVTLRFETIHPMERVNFTYTDGYGITFVGFQGYTYGTISLTGPPNYVNVPYGFMTSVRLYLRNDDSYSVTIQVYSEENGAGSQLFIQTYSVAASVQTITFTGIAKSLKFTSSCSGCASFDDLNFLLLGVPQTAVPTSTVPPITTTTTFLFDSLIPGPIDDYYQQVGVTFSGFFNGVENPGVIYFKNTPSYVNVPNGFFGSVQFFFNDTTGFSMFATVYSGEYGTGGILNGLQANSVRKTFTMDFNGIARSIKFEAPYCSTGCAKFDNFTFNLISLPVTPTTTPTSVVPTTVLPTTVIPTTVVPTTAAPTTAVPTAVPTTAVPTTTPPLPVKNATEILQQEIITKEESRIVLEAIQNSTEVNNTTKVLDNVVTLAVGLIKGGLNTTNVTTSRLSIAVQVIQSNSSVEMGGDQLKSSATIPSGAINAVNATGAFALLTVFSYNPYEELKGNETIISGVTSLSVLNSEGKEISVSGLDGDDLISLNITFNSDTYVSGSELSCIWWNIDEKVWTNSGCSLQLSSQGDSAICSCSHLTSFTISQKSKPIVQDNPQSDKKSINLVVIIVPIVGGVLLIALIVIVIFIVLKKKKQPVSVDLEMESSDLIPKESIEIHEKIGQGAYGFVFRGTYQSTTTVAVKQVAKESNNLSFLREAEILKTLHHPHVIQFLGMYKDSQSHLCMVLEYMNKGSLLDQLRGQTLDPNQLLRIACDISAGISYLHELNIVHCDLAARNILLSGENRAKISDFGMSFTKGGKEPTSDPAVRWASLEVLNSREYSSKSDVWSYGVILWEIYNQGKVPYHQVHNNEKVQSQVEKGLRLEFPSDTPKEVRTVAQSCWKEQSERPKMKFVFDTLSAILKSDEIENNMGFEKTDIYVGIDK